MSLSNIKDYFLKLMNLSTSVVQFGIPMISVGTVGAMMGAIVASMLDSCADYIAYARTMIPNASQNTPRAEGLPWKELQPSYQVGS